MKLFSAFLLLLTPWGSFAQGEVETLVNRAVQSYVASPHHRGLLVGIVEDGRQQFFSYGETTQGGHPLPDSVSLFEIGQLTEVFTTTLLADLVMEGQLHTDDSLAKLFPPNVRVPAYARIACEPEQLVLQSDGETDDPLLRTTRYQCIPANLDQTAPILLCDLATHTTGLPGLKRRHFQRQKNAVAPYTEADLYRFMNGYEFNKPSSFIYRYSPLNTALLGLALSLKTGQPFEALLIDRICGPIGLPDTRLTLNANQQQRLLAGHSRKGQPTPPGPSDALAPAAGLRSTAKDLLRFTAAQLGLIHDDWYFKVSFAHNPRYPVHQKGRPNGEVGLGWLLTPLGEAGTKVIWRQGQTGGFCAYLGFVKETNTGVVILSNTANAVDQIGVGLLGELNQRRMVVKAR
ncbi:MAG: beta-lactamase family protein [Ferruginibacter sp.]|nr:beta-lactamase family protein [Cytophagales bacterium]